MAQLEEVTRGATIGGILPDGLVTVVDVKWVGTVAIEVTYKDASGQLGSELLYRDREPTLELATTGSPWSFDGDGALFRLLSEANRIRLAYLFDPLLAVHTSLVEPLPHQITAVYSEMITRQPLRFLLADDPGAGKTNARLNSGLARQRADDLTGRLNRRTEELQQERKLSPLPPVVLGGALVVPLGFLRKLRGTAGDSEPRMFARDTERSEMLTMNAVMATERELGNVPRDVSKEKSAMCHAM